MALPVIDATPGSASANSYGTAQGLKDYAEARPHSPVLPTPDDALSPLLLFGTRILDTSVPKGSRTFSQGALLWPRMGVRTNDKAGVYYYSSTLIPDPLEKGLYEICLDLIERNIVAPSDLAGYTEVKIGSLNFKADTSTEIGLYSPQVEIYIEHLFVSLTGEPQNFCSVVRV